MKSFKEFISESSRSSDVHSDLVKLGKHTDQGGGYHVYMPHKPTKVDSVVATLKKHGFERSKRYRSGGEMPADMHCYKRTPAPYHTETINVDHIDGKVSHIKRSLQRG